MQQLGHLSALHDATRDALQQWRQRHWRVAKHVERAELAQRRQRQPCPAYVRQAGKERLQHRASLLLRRLASIAARRVVQLCRNRVPRVRMDSRWRREGHTPWHLVLLCTHSSQGAQVPRVQGGDGRAPAFDATAQALCRGTHQRECCFSSGGVGLQLYNCQRVAGTPAHVRGRC
eukprot:351323-Chlamydomonas_euryale.AAC.8